MKQQDLSTEMIRILPKGALARKYSCSVQYVRKILQGQSRHNSPRARAILYDALEIIRILEAKPNHSIEETHKSTWPTSQTSISNTNISIDSYIYEDNKKNLQK